MKFMISILFAGWLGGALAQSPITGAEYFVDNDPGVGNAVPISIDPGNSVSFNFEVDLDALLPGVHYLHTRVVNAQGNWSLYARRPFYVTDFDFGQTIISAAYFFDEDPGIGNGTDLPITTGSQISESFAIPLGDLETGMHMLHLRVQNSQNKWSHYARKMIYILPEYPDAVITAAEYFIDTDPGPGNANAIAIAPGQSLSEALVIETSEDLSLGDHILHIRVWTDEQKWSLYARETFTVDNQVGIADTEERFQFFPNPTTDYLYIESTIPDQPLSIVIIDMKGVVVDSYHLNGNQIDLSPLPPAEYLVTLETVDGKKVSKKIIKR